jgi:hypothetical protein
MDEYDEGYDWSLLEDAVEYDFTGWQPEEGDSIIGTVAYVTEGQGNYDPYPMVAVITKEGASVMIHAFHLVLQSAIERQKPVAGDKIAVKYIGRKPSKVPGNDPMHVYNVVVHHAQGGIAMTAPEAAPALPSGDGDADGEGPGEPPGWEQPALAEDPPAPAPAADDGELASQAQMSAIDTLRERQGLPAVDWSKGTVTAQMARDHIQELQPRKS